MSWGHLPVKQTEPFVRWMIRRDLPTVLRIAAESATCVAAWDEAEFLSVLHQRNTIGMVVECPTTYEPLGFMIYELSKKHLEVVNFAVHPVHRGNGYGKLMIQKLNHKLNQQGRNQVRILIHEADLPFQLFLKHNGFIAECVIRSHYDDGQDAYAFMMRRQEEQTVQPEPPDFGTDADGYTIL